MGEVFLFEGFFFFFESPPFFCIFGWELGLGTWEREGVCVCEWERVSGRVEVGGGIRRYEV